MTVIMTPPSSASKTTKQLLFLYRVVKFLSVIRLIRSPDKLRSIQPNNIYPYYIFVNIDPTPNIPPLEYVPPRNPPPALPPSIGRATS